MLGPWVVSDAGFWSDGGGAYHFDVIDAIYGSLGEMIQEGAMRQGVVESAMRQMEGAMVKKSRQASTFSKIFNIDGGGGSCSKLFPACADGITPGFGGQFDDMSLFATTLTRMDATTSGM